MKKEGQSVFLREAGHEFGTWVAKSVGKWEKTGESSNGKDRSVFLNPAISVQVQQEEALKERWLGVLT